MGEENKKKGCLGCAPVGCGTLIVLFLGVSFVRYAVKSSVDQVQSPTPSRSVVTTTVAETQPPQRSAPAAKETTSTTVTTSVTEIEAAVASDESYDTVAESETTEGSSLIKGVTPEFKAQMDAYEAFFDEYIAFMSSYSSDNADTSGMFLQYMDMLGKYAECMSAMESIDQDELSEADLAYYIEVTMRIEAKLLGSMSKMGS